MSVKLKHALILCARIAGTVAAFAVAAVVLNEFDYFTQWSQVDNVIGALPIAFALLFAGGCTILIWMKHGKKSAPFAIVLAVFVALTAILYPNALYLANQKSAGSPPRFCCIWI